MFNCSRYFCGSNYFVFYKIQCSIGFVSIAGESFTFPFWLAVAPKVKTLWFWQRILKISSSGFSKQHRHLAGQIPWWICKVVDLSERSNFLSRHLLFFLSSLQNMLRMISLGPWNEVIWCGARKCLWKTWELFKSVIRVSHRAFGPLLWAHITSSKYSVVTSWLSYGFQSWILLEKL